MLVSKFEVCTSKNRNLSKRKRLVDYEVVQE